MIFRRLIDLATSQALTAASVFCSDLYSRLFVSFSDDSDLVIFPSVAKFPETDLIPSGSQGEFSDFMVLQIPGYL